VHRRGRERTGAPDRGAEEGTPFVAGDAGGTNVLIEERFELVMRRHFVAVPDATKFKDAQWSETGDEGQLNTTGGHGSSSLVSAIAYGTTQLPRVAWYAGHGLAMRRLAEAARKRW
jgi:hypothetical protein